MNTAHWHLLLNHLPIIGTVMGVITLTGGYLFKNNAVVKQTALALLVISALAAIPAYLTGEGAEEMVEKIPGTGEAFIETHEEAAKIFLITVLALGALSLITLVLSATKTKATEYLYVTVLVVSVGTCVYAQKVGTSGGEIRHTEIRASNAAQGINTPANNGTENDED